MTKARETMKDNVGKAQPMHQSVVEMFKLLEQFNPILKAEEVRPAKFVKDRTIKWVGMGRERNEA